jgi:thiol:disulfide interchange protein DsbD
MKSIRLLITLLLLVSLSSVFGQMAKPVKWNFSVNTISKTEAELVLSANIQKDWHMYSINQPTEDGGMPLVIEFAKSSNYKLDGKIIEPKPKEEFDKGFEVKVRIFENQVTFKQKIQILTPGSFSIKGTLNGQACAESCVLFDETFEFKMEGKEGSPVQSQMEKPVKWDFALTKISDSEGELTFKASIEKGWHLYSMVQEQHGLPPVAITFTFDPSDKYKLSGKIDEPKPITEYDKDEKINTYFFKDEVIYKQKVKILSSDPFFIKGSIHFQACSDVCIQDDADFEFPMNGATGASNGLPDTEASAVADTAGKQVPNQLSAECGDWASGDFVADNSIWGIFIAGFIGGLLALLTPCVFPMIPMTVSFFTKQSGNRRKGIMNALIYAASIIVIYVLLGMLVTVTLGSDALNDMSTNGFFNMAFFIIFIVFAISFFGTFEIVLPSSLVNKVDRASDRGGLIGIFFMAFTLSLVSFSCTGPIIGTLLVEAAHGRSYLGPVTGMTGFATALALPFALFAAFPGWLNSLPKSGGWLNSVKVCLGFVELALALKFLSNVDLAYHWGIITREIFISLWAIVFGLMGFYLLGKLRFSHDSEVKHLTSSRLIFALLTLTFTLYMIPGIWGAPLKLLSGILPPEYYKEWKEKGATDCPHDLSCFHDYDEGMAFAKAQGKPVFIDFTGYNCANCRKMEDNIWVDPRVLKRLSDNYVLISLYVDDKAKLPEEKQYTSKFSGKKIITCGNKWSDMQAERYSSNTQPMYVLIDNKETQLAKSWKGYENAPDKYVKFLDEGLCRYEKRKE